MACRLHPQRITLTPDGVPQRSARKMPHSSQVKLLLTAGAAHYADFMSRAKAFFLADASAAVVGVAWAGALRLPDERGAAV